MNKVLEKLNGKKLPLSILFAGIATMTGSQIHYALEMAKEVREHNPELKIVFGGTHPTIMPKQTLENKYVDIVVRGEGEETCLELAKTIEKNEDYSKLRGTNLNEPRKFLDVNKLPETPWEIIDVEKYIVKSVYLEKGDRMLDIGETSRGCPYMCKFCCSAHIKKGIWRPLTAENAVKKIVNDVRKFNLDSIWIRDDNFYVDLKRNEEIFKGIIKEKLDIKWYTAGTRVNTFNSMKPDFIELLKKSGGNCIKLGAESGSDRILKLINKRQTRQDIINANLKAKRYGLIPAYSFMCGFPTETEQEFFQTIDLMIHITKENPKAILECLSIFTPHPGTPLFDLSVEHGLKPPTKLEDWVTYSFWNKAHTPWLSKERIKVLENAADIFLYAGKGSKAAFETIKNPIQKALYLAIFTPINKYYQYRMNHKYFKYDPLLKVMRLARKIRFDKVTSVTG